MNQTILIHGAPYEKEFYDATKPSPSNGVWLPWLQKQFALKNELCQVLEFPRPFDPIYEEWVKVFEQLKFNEETTLIGHSCGGGFLLRYLSEHQIKVNKVFLVAPWIDPDKELTTGFFDFEINPMISDHNEIHILLSTDDGPDLLKSFEIIKSALPKVTYHEHSDKGHFTEKQIPELLPLL
jgi:predicted alpha/beta hydrolase family esterase